MPGGGVRAVHDVIRMMSPRLVDDRSLSADIELVAEAIRSGAVVAAAEAEVGELA
jgi:histidine ammonia-lyase